MVIDYLVIGQGIAGTCLAYTLKKKGYSVLIINQIEECNSSEVAAGIFNPITGKRCVKTWMAPTLFPYAKEFYKEIEKTIGVQILYERDILKVFGSQEQQTDLLVKSNDAHYVDYVDLRINEEALTPVLNIPHGAVGILKGGWCNTKRFIESSRDFFKSNNTYREELFVPSLLEISTDAVTYKDVTAKAIILCQGHHAIQNELMNWLPFSVTKGEMLVIKAPSLPQDRIINKNIFLLPKGDHEFLVGASFDRKIDKLLTEGGKAYVIEKLDALLNVDYTIVDHVVGIRPTVRDRRPFIGRHPNYKNVYIFNGLGAKGVSLAPYFANELVDNITTNKELNKEVNISRYYSLYSGQ